MTSYLCDRALIGGRVEDDVLLTVADGRFEHVVVGSAPPSDAVRLAGLTLPGMANAHSHAFHRALRSRTQTGRGTFWTWRSLMYAAAERLDPDSYHRLARATFAEMAMAGITSVGEFHYLHHQVDGTPYANPNVMGEALFAAASEAGIRITLLDTLYLHGGLGADGYVAPVGVQRRFRDADVDAWAERVSSLSPANGQLVGAAIHSVRAVDPAAMKVAAEWARSESAPLHAHVSEQRAENEQCGAHHEMTPMAVFSAAGALSGRFSAVHATHLHEDDIDLLVAGDSSVCLCPTTERDLGDGIGPTTDLAEAGVDITLGTDSHAVIDLLEECRAVEMDERLRSEQRGHHAAAELLDMATGVGPRSLGWPDAGSLVVGNRADLVAVDLDSVRTAGAEFGAALEALIFAATATDVTTVVVDGAVVVEDGRHVHLDVADELDASIRELMEG